MILLNRGAHRIFEALSATWLGYLVATGFWKLQYLKTKKGKGFQEINVNLAQVCGAVSKAEEKELCSKQLELVVGKLSQPGVSASTMSDCMVRKF